MAVGRWAAWCPTERARAQLATLTSRTGLEVRPDLTWPDLTSISSGSGGLMSQLTLTVLSVCLLTFSFSLCLVVTVVCLSRRAASKKRELLRNTLNSRWIWEGGWPGSICLLVVFLLSLTCPGWAELISQSGDRDRRRRECTPRGRPGTGYDYRERNILPSNTNTFLLVVRKVQLAETCIKSYWITSMGSLFGDENIREVSVFDQTTAWDWEERRQGGLSWQCVGPLPLYCCS